MKNFWVFDAYEITCKTHDELDEHENNLPKNRKDLVLRTQEDYSSENLSDDDFELLTINLKKFMKQELKNKNKLKKNTTTCCKHKKPGHSKDEYIKLKKKLPKKKEALKDESSVSKDEEQTNKDEMTFHNEVCNSPEIYLLYHEIT